MEIEVKIEGRGTNEGGYLLKVTQRLIEQITWSFYPVVGTAVGPEESVRRRTGTEYLLSQGLCYTKEETCQTNVPERRILLLLRLIRGTHPPAVERDFGISNKMRLDWELARITWLQNLG